MHSHLVVGGAERGVACGRPVLRAVDECLGMLDAHAHRERLALEEKTLFAHELEHVACGMAARDHEPACGSLGDRAGRAVLDMHGAKRPVAQGNARKTGHEPDFPTRSDDALAQVSHDSGQLVGADMGFRLPEDLLRGAGGNKRLEHVPDVRALRARGEFAIGKRPRSPFPELHVRARIERTAPVERLDDRHALLNSGAAFHHKRAQTRLGQVERAEQARRTGAGDDDARIAFPNGTGKIGDRKRGGRVPCAHAHAAQRANLLQGAFDKLDSKRRIEVDVVLLARVDAAFRQGERSDVLCAKTESARKLALRRFRRLATRASDIERQGNARYFKRRSSGKRRKIDPIALGMRPVSTARMR